MSQSTLPLPPFLHSLIDAINHPSGPLFITPFTPTATLTDEGKTKTGTAEIQAWFQTALLDRGAEAKLASWFADPLYTQDERKGEGEKGKRTIWLEVQLQGDYEKDYGIVGWFTLWWEVKVVKVQESEGEKELIESLVMTPKDPRGEESKDA